MTGAATTLDAVRDRIDEITAPVISFGPPAITRPAPRRRAADESAAA